jgi:hypothetical protein
VVLAKILLAFGLSKSLAKVKKGGQSYDVKKF